LRDGVIANRVGLTKGGQAVGNHIDAADTAPALSRILALRDTRIVPVAINALTVTEPVAPEPSGLGVESLRPVVVHRTSLTVIDGHHRVITAAARGVSTVPATMFDGSTCEGWLLAINLRNAREPLPLQTHRDLGRSLLLSHPGWSDRAIASFVGLSDKTVAGIRRTAAPAESSDLQRVDLDGASRPLNCEQARLGAAEQFHDHPHGSARDVSQRTGLSMTTVKDARKRLRDGEDPPQRSVSIPHQAAAAITGGRRGAAPATALPARTPAATSDVARHRTTMANELACIGEDPSIRLSIAGRQLVSLFALPDWLDGDPQSVVAALPFHRLPRLRLIAHSYLVLMADLTNMIDERIRCEHPRAEAAGTCRENPRVAASPIRHCARAPT
jgi:hypothetical protein